MSTTNSLVDTLDSWLESCRNKGRISRNTIAVGIVILEHLLAKCPLEKEDVLSARGEIKGARGKTFRDTLGRYGINHEKFLKEITTRQAHQDGQRLLDHLAWGRAMQKMPTAARTTDLEDGMRRLVSLASAWMGRQHLRISCDQQRSPAAWIGLILDEAKGRSGGKVEQHLVGAKLEARHPEVAIANHPGHAGDAQTNRPGDFMVGSTCYHVTATPGGAVIEKCSANLGSRLHPVLLVPRSQVDKARHLAEDHGISDRVTVLSIEDFIAQNIIEMAVGQQEKFVATFNDILSRYNRRLESVETDMSLKIEIR